MELALLFDAGALALLTKSDGKHSAGRPVPRCCNAGLASILYMEQVDHAMQEAQACLQVLRWRCNSASWILGAQRAACAKLGSSGVDVGPSVGGSKLMY